MNFVVLTNMIWKALGASWHEARIVCLTEMLQGILTSQSINTARMAARMGGQVQFESHAQRICFSVCTQTRRSSSSPLRSWSGQINVCRYLFTSGVGGFQVATGGWFWVAAGANASAAWMKENGRNGVRKNKSIASWALLMPGP